MTNSGLPGSAFVQHQVFFFSLTRLFNYQPLIDIGFPVNKHISIIFKRALFHIGWAFIQQLSSVGHLSKEKTAMNGSHPLKLLEPAEYARKLLTFGSVFNFVSFHLLRAKGFFFQTVCVCFCLCPRSEHNEVGWSHYSSE